MLLSKKDVKRLEDRGYRKKQFVRYDKHGYAYLRNREGYCVFYDQTCRRCSEYESRPSGCRVYPVIVDEEHGIILDSICEARDSITEQEKSVKGRRVVRLLEVIDAEAALRRA
jgi:Fe-S-cluster containining protein